MANLDIINKIFDEVLDLYKNRRKTQEDIAEEMNLKYHTSLTRAHISEITQKYGYHHTIKTDDLKRLIIVVSPSLKKALENAR